ncbi:UDP-glycosyltransferase 86a1 [Phtheirospermum japonicum]|uniref:Glycosyltransferase n=1 Tax=Phtheirospermum japonicum TaxID=374723 RepID=A0A830BME3_9LAMI|nr:UDP-glycosyltransferase 86a1 [Phtheirospermum japonicum]
MIAIPLQGHINPFVQLAIKLASKGFTITFVNTEYIHHQISTSNGNQFDIFAGARESGLDIRYATISDGFPLDFDRKQNMGVFWESMLSNFPLLVDEFVGKVLIEECSSSDHQMCLVADTFYTWPATIAEKYNMANVSFWTQPAMVYAISFHLDLLRENGHFPPTGNNEENTINYIPGIKSFRRKDLMSHFQESDTSTIVHKMVFKAFEEVKKADFVLHNTMHELESYTLSTLNRNQPTYAIGPINFSNHQFHNIISVSKSIHSEVDCTKWLDSKPLGSVLYVSFGSHVRVNQHVFEEIAQGLVLSGVDFIWAIRPQQIDHDKNNLDNVDRERGLIVSWCNQIDVLSNTAVGAFLTHCGWNSILESIWCGVPMICYPVLYDQPTNRKLVVDDWKVGIDLCDDHRTCPITRVNVADKVKRFMSNGREMMSQEMKKLRSIVHNALAEDGSSEKNFDQFLRDLENKMQRIILN